MKKWILFVCCIAGLSQLNWAQEVPYADLDTAKVYSDIAKALENPDYVYRLNLTRKRLKEVPEEILQFKNLQELNLNRNKLDSLPPWLNQLQNLMVFSASRNEIEAIPKELCRLPELRVLDMSNNYLKAIPENINKAKKLEELILWSNLISDFPPTLAQCDNLKLLDLLHNEMSVNEQERIKFLLPDINIIMSPPCQCEFDNDDE